VIEEFRMAGARRWTTAAFSLALGAATAAQAASAPDFLFESAGTGGNEVHGKKVWAQVYPYRPDHSMKLDPALPVPYRTFSETFEY
jgi:hypothetical protein